MRSLLPLTIAGLATTATAGYHGHNPHNATAPSADQVCSELFNAIPGKVAFNPNGTSASKSASLSDLYNTTRTQYWNTANALDYPDCMVFPSCAQEVSTAVKILRKARDVPFALKSGGHNWNRGYSSVNGGVLITFRPNLQSVSLSADHSVAYVGPGAKWREVMAYLNQYNRCAVGGRNDDVGVGGYVILGGLSYLTGHYGFASDNVVDFEVVLADGSIVHANATSHPDLYFSLRGGGNNFGIVTNYSLVAHPIGQVWGGPRTYTDDKAPQLLNAIASYYEKFNEATQPSALLPTIAWPAILNGTNIWTVFFFWDGTSPPADLFSEFDNITALVDGVKVQSYPELLNMSAETALFAGRTTDRVAPLANLPRTEMVEFLTWHVDQAKKAPFLTDKDSGFVLFSMALQPIPVLLQKANSVGIPGALSVNPAGGDKMWIEYSLVWSNATADDRLEYQLAQLAIEGQAYEELHYPNVKPTNYTSGVLPDVAYNPIFSNDGQNGQLIYQSYGEETYWKLVAARQKYDPTLFFQTRTNGFHLELPNFQNGF